MTIPSVQQSESEAKHIILKHIPVVLHILCTSSEIEAPLSLMRRIHHILHFYFFSIYLCTPSQRSVECRRPQGAKT